MFLGTSLSALERLLGWENWPELKSITAAFLFMSQIPG